MPACRVSTVGAVEEAMRAATVCEIRSDALAKLMAEARQALQQASATVAAVAEAEAEAKAVVAAAAVRLRVEKEEDEAALDAERARLEVEVTAAKATSRRLGLEFEAARAAAARLSVRQQAERGVAMALVQRLGGERAAAEAVTARLQAKQETLEAAAAVAAVAARVRLEEEAAYHQLRFQQAQEELGRSGEEELCVVCVDARKDRAMVPCGHVCACETCAAELMRITPNRCPICRERVLFVMRVFL
jgi:hypothetical protein